MFKMQLLKTKSLCHSTGYLFFVSWVICITQSQQREKVRLEKVWQDIKIDEQYDFLSPKINIHCACYTNQDNWETRCDNYQDFATEICINRNVSNRAQCSIKIRPASAKNWFTAYKINHSKQQVYIRISYPTENNRQHIDVPRGIFRIKTTDNSILKIDTSSNKIDALNAFTWFYGEKDGNDLRCETEMNEAGEKSPSKLGWYRPNVATGKYDVDEEAVKNKLWINDQGCPIEDVTWKFHGVHYYNPHGLLKSNIPGKTINEITGGIVDDIKVNQKHKTISMEYNKNSHIVNFLPAYGSESFNFSATMTLDKYHNKLIHVTIYEVKATIVNVEIGIPGTTRSMMSFYHEKPNQIHHYRISGYVIGWQWVCAYPADEIQRCTCVNAGYNDDSIPKPRGNGSSYNFSDFARKPPRLKNEISQFSQAASVGNRNINEMYIVIIGAVVCVIAFIAFLFRRQIIRYFGQKVQYSDVQQNSV